jgi:hypothetical protein
MKSPGAFEICDVSGLAIDCCRHHLRGARKIHAAGLVVSRMLQDAIISQPEVERSAASYISKISM